MSFVHKIICAFILFVMSATGFANAFPLWYAWSPATSAYEGPAFGAAYWSTGNGTENHQASAYGNWDYRIYRGAFQYTFTGLDSLYRENYWNLESALVWKYAGVGGGYGVSVAWVPGEVRWSRHHYDFGVLGHFGGISATVAVAGFTDENPQLVSSAYWMPSSGFRMYGRYADGYGVLGDSLLFSHIRLDFSARIPGFAVALGVAFSLNRWDLGAFHWFGGDDLDCNAFWFSKKIKK